MDIGSEDGALLARQPPDLLERLYLIVKPEMAEGRTAYALIFGEKEPKVLQQIGSNRRLSSRTTDPRPYSVSPTAFRGLWSPGCAVSSGSVKRFATFEPVRHRPRTPTTRECTPEDPGIRLRTRCTRKSSGKSTYYTYRRSKRRGAQVTAFSRIDDRPIRLRTSITTPDIVVVLDPGLLKGVPVTAGAKPGGLLLLDTEGAPGRPRVPVLGRAGAA